MSWWRRLVARRRRRRYDRALAGFRPRQPQRFFIVTAAYNAGAFIEANLRSIAAQRVDPARVTQLVYDDASSDDTSARVEAWRAANPGAHAVELVRNPDNRGGCANLTEGFRRAPASSIVLQVDGDDRLADANVLRYLDLIYDDPDVWMTYNSWAFPDGRPSLNSEALPEEIVAGNRAREHIWITSHLHSFRQPLFTHVREESLRDPATGDYWRACVDIAQFMPMLELAGDHAVHVPRVMYLYNLHDDSIFVSRRQEQVDCEARIRALSRYEPLATLSPAP